MTSYIGRYITLFWRNSIHSCTKPHAKVSQYLCT